MRTSQYSLFFLASMAAVGLSACGKKKSSSKSETIQSATGVNTPTSAPEVVTPLVVSSHMIASKWSNSELAVLIAFKTNKPGTEITSFTVGSSSVTDHFSNQAREELSVLKATSGSAFPELDAAAVASVISGNEGQPYFYVGGAFILVEKRIRTHSAKITARALDGTTAEYSFTLPGFNL